MRLIGVRFVSLMLAALTLGMGLAHLMQLPARMSWDQYLWVGSTVQGGLYSLFGSVGVVIDVATVIALGLLTYLVREHHTPGIRLCALRRASVRDWALAVVGAGLSSQCRAGEMGQRSGANRLDHVPRAVGVGPRDDLAVRALWLCRADRLGARRHAAQ